MTMDDIFWAVVDGDAEATADYVREALAEGLTPESILQDGLIRAMGEVGRQFECEEIFVPEMLVAARAMQAGVAELRPALTQAGYAPKYTVVLGTVKGDMHDIGKSLVGMMLEGAGFRVIDLGVDVAPERFVEAARGGVHILGMSALLTTTMPNMARVIEALRVAGVRDGLKVLVGGAPLTASFAEAIGADRYAADASAGARAAVALMEAV
jgi:5-methyltetrahydrofolate--homocysteine methyltransferase